MCHLDSLKMFKKPLPAKGDFKYIWEKVTKGINLSILNALPKHKHCSVIDELHWRNHVENCKVQWNPKQIREIYPNANLVCCEQTFAWLGIIKNNLHNNCFENNY